jgi:hypothetical protein
VLCGIGSSLRASTPKGAHRARRIPGPRCRKNSLVPAPTEAQFFSASMLKVVVALALFAPPSGAQSACALRVDSLTQYGLAFRVYIHNRADQAVRLRVLRVTFADALQQYQERAYS